VTKQQTQAKAVADMVDELGDLELELADIKPKIQRAETLKRALRAPYDSEDPTLPFEIRGGRWAALLSAAGNESTVNTELLYKLVGSKAFVPVASVSIKALQDHFGADVVGAVVRTEQTGSRKLQLLPLDLLAKRKAS
jgi:hypothetical protein